MTKFYGSLVGVAVVASPRPLTIPMGRKMYTDHGIVRDRVLLAAAAIADTISLGFMAWETVIAPASDIWWDALGASTTLKIGDITFPSALSAAFATNAAGTTKILSSVPIGNYFKTLWEQLGYADLKTAQAVGVQCEILAKIAGGACTGNVVWQISGQPR